MAIVDAMMVPVVEYTYDPETGRFVSADILLNQNSILGNRLSAYCRNNPVTNQDPSENFVILLLWR